MNEYAAQIVLEGDGVLYIAMPHILPQWIPFEHNSGALPIVIVTLAACTVVTTGSCQSDIVMRDSILLTRSKWSM